MAWTNSGFKPLFEENPRHMEQQSNVQTRKRIINKFLNNQKEKAKKEDLMMIKKRIVLILTAAVMLQAFAACGGAEKKEDNAAAVNVETSAAGESEAKEDNYTQADQEEKADVSDKVATADEMVTPEDVVEEGMVPIYGDAVKDGIYEVTVDSSSSMFHITECELTVENGDMSAVITMSGTGYLQLFMGTGVEAVEASADSYISYEENENGEYTFTVPVEALDMGIDCAAFSKKKEKWYDRILVFRADSLPQSAFAEGMITTVEDLALADGTYQIAVTLAGGSGKTTVDSPAKLVVADGTATATIVFSSPNYDYMLVNGERYEPVNTEGNSTFEIQVTGFDWKMPVTADTTAMSTPHEIEYTLYFDSSTIE